MERKEKQWLISAAFSETFQRLIEAVRVDPCPLRGPRPDLVDTKRLVCGQMPTFGAHRRYVGDDSFELCRARILKGGPDSDFFSLLVINHGLIALAFGDIPTGVTPSIFAYSSRGFAQITIDYSESCQCDAITAMESSSWLNPKNEGVAPTANVTPSSRGRRRTSRRRSAGARRSSASRRRRGRR